MKKIIIAICFICAGIILGLNTTLTEASDPIGIDEDREICNTGTGNCTVATIVHSCDDDSCPKL